MLERKTVKFEIKAVNEEEGVIEGYGSTFSKVPDSYGDVVDEGAFLKTIQENADNIVSLFNHDIMSPIGKPALSTDKKGLYTKIKLVRGVQKAEETLLLAKAGVITQMSIGYKTIKEGREKGIRHLQEVKLYDVSPVIFAANPEALITGVKNELETLIKSGRVLSAANVGKVQAALNALQALLDAAEGEAEPAKATPEPEEATAAAEMERVVNALKAENDAFLTRAAEARIEAILDQLTKIKQEAN